ncbi:helix-turn-helix domain-containing protein [Ekhidna sp. To15]|uniref:helix-turn-helix domain-containing protein n=1 Tax=Ekhidna sp. To15 TaxID=3395267 RepID=UPI003F51B438
MEDQLKDRISSLLIELRTAKGYSQEKLANLADVDRSYISRVERKLIVPTISHLIKICQPLGITASEFLKRVEG